MKDYVLLTGVTGQLGRYLLKDLTRAGVRLAVLVRAGGDLTPTVRVWQLLRDWAARGVELESPVVLTGDVNLPGLGLGAAALDWAKENCRAVVHNAASLDFHSPGGLDHEPWRTNYTGTDNVLAFCKAAGVREFHHVSTAYVCGRTPSFLEVSEDVLLEPAGGFRNEYEKSKHAAEKLVRSHLATGQLSSLTVYRPSMVVGDSKSGYTHTYHGIYPYLRIAQKLVDGLPRGADGYVELPVRLNLTGDERRNLVPIDWVSAVTARVVANPDLHGRTYHLTPPEPVTARELEAAMASCLRFRGPSFVGAAGVPDPTEIERAFYDYVGTYQPYWHEEPRFSCRNAREAAPDLPCPKLDEAFIHRLYDYAVSDRWGKKRK